MLDPRRYHYQPTISFPVISDDISLQQQQKPHTNNNICQTKNPNNPPHESGMCSPPLWTTKSNKSINYRSLSPESKTEAIERGQRELMEMVKNMPESSYELTLKDLVEQQQQQHHHHHHVEETNNNINRVVKQKSLNNKKANKREGMMDKRSISAGHRNIDSGGFYLKMVFPISLGSSKKQYYKKNKDSSLVNSNNNNNNSKVSPRTSSVSDHGSVNKDWWKKKKTGSEYGGESDHSASTKRSGSINSSCSSSRSNTSRHEISGSSCWPFTRRSEILSQK